MTLLQAINRFIDNISVTDRQESSIRTSLDNINYYLKNKDNSLHVKRTFTNGSYERDTIIRPLNDIDIFAVLDIEKWKDDFGLLPTPQDVLTAIKDYLNDVPDYKGKVKQDRPCVTVKLSDKHFDILPCFELYGEGYQIPNHDLSGWTYSYPEKLQTDLDNIHKERGYKVKSIIKAIKYWNRDLDKLIPSYHIEEAAIDIFSFYGFKSFQEGIELWFEHAGTYLVSAKFKSYRQYEKAIEKVNNVVTKLEKAAEKCGEGEETEALLIWKDIFGKDFPTIDPEEAKNFSKAISEGTLKVAGTGLLSTVSGYSITASRGYHGGLSKE
ncbi:SMODS domain-containing nucleotidyltransferase [Sphingobacterium thalpophilum]|uniref:tRNA CCA-pyrophosphorylase n=1 Tax=Sphingobacterium thalpophilum TaxID=259 RepID=A0A4U9UCL7_9SPHI|nr:nucleotidyltransferase [Sphingobacterium thalpophilum]VTR29699.1 tRNA CCA-pyrophosphorylase [Sphingobacterium thalpophilum]